MNHLSIGVLLLSGAALAQQNAPAGGFIAPPGDPTGQPNVSEFVRFDADRDGAISRNEAREDRQLASRFGQIDRDRDGKVSQEEYNLSAARRARPQP